VCVGDERVWVAGDDLCGVGARSERCESYGVDVDVLCQDGFATHRYGPHGGGFFDGLASPHEVSDSVVGSWIASSVGLQAVLVSSSSTASPIPYDEFCDTPGMEQLVPPEDCNVCADVSLYLWIGMLVAMVAYLPTVASDCLRLHSSYDVNCQKTVACFWSLISLAGYGLVYHYFEYVCLASFFRGPVMYSANGIVVEEGESTGVVKVDFEWKLGTGQICLYVGFFLKAIDLLCNCCLVTPAITRSRKEQWEYERLSEQSELEAPPRKRENSEENEDSSSSSED